MTDQVDRALAELAERIANNLMTNGASEQAQRLVLELPDGRDGGGRCEASVISTVAAEFTASGFRELVEAAVVVDASADIDDHTDCDCHLCKLREALARFEKEKGE